MNRKKIKAPKLHKRNEKYKSEKYKDNNIAPPPLMDMTLQTMIGNQEVQRLFKMHEIMAKLLISQSGDVYEQEANRIAEKIVNIKDPPQTTPNSSITEIIQAKFKARYNFFSSSNKSEIKNLDGKGKPLSKRLRDYYQPRFGVDLGNVRIHKESNADRLARAIRARAFTYGNNIVFAKSAYRPETKEGKKLIAHELSHVLQQKNSQNFIIQKNEDERSKNDISDIFTIKSTHGNTVKVGTDVIFYIVPIQSNVDINEYEFHWFCRNENATYNIFSKFRQGVKDKIYGPKNVLKWKVKAVFPGKHKVGVNFYRKASYISTLTFFITVNDNNITSLHLELMRLAELARVDKNVTEWTTGDILKWKMPFLGDPKYIHKFKEQWVKGYRDVIKKAALKFDLPPLLVAGVAYNEVGGDPLWIDDIAYGIRSFDHMADPVLEPLTITKKPQLTSFGNVSMQIRTAAETLGYNPSKMNEEQKKLIINSLKNSKLNIFIAAKHLADLRNIDFPGKKAKGWSMEEIQITATRFNRGPSLSLKAIKKNLSYGKAITKRASTLLNLLQ